MIKGFWLDGKTSQSLPAGLRLTAGGRAQAFRLDNQEELATAECKDLRPSPRLAGAARFIRFPGQGKFETRDNQAVDELLGRMGKRSAFTLVHFIESRWRYVLICLLVLGMAIWGAVRYGLPAAAKLIALSLPAWVYDKADDSSINLLDRALLSPSKLPEPRIQQVRGHFAPVLAQYPGLKLKVLFRHGGKLGANALALPGGSIIFTDEMVNLARHDDELVAVLAHEIGHVAGRHTMRSLVQNSLLSFAILSITGDVSGTSEIFLGLPVFLTEMHYSREFEREADAFSLDYLKKHQIPLRRFADLMRRLAEQAGGAGPDSKISGYLTTHPRTEERLIPFEQVDPDNRE